MLRVCIDCRIPKSTDEFYYNPSRTDRLQTRCIPCYIEVQRTYYYAKTQRKLSKLKDKPKLDPRICIVCLKPFTRRSKEARKRFLQRKTCTPECQRLSRPKPQPKPVPRPKQQRDACAYLACQKLFKAGKSTAPYCSRQCRRMGQSANLALTGELLCPYCNMVQPLSNFYKNKRKRNGYESQCKTCRSQQQKDFREKNPEHVRLRYAKYPKHRSTKPAADRKAYRRQYYLNTKAQHAARDRRWRQTHPEHVARQRQVKHARKMGAPVVEKVDRLAIYLRDKWICQICFTKVRRRDASLDHVIPLSKGGEHSARNLVLAHKSCNSMKGNRVVIQQMRLFG